MGKKNSKRLGRKRVKRPSAGPARKKKNGQKRLGRKRINPLSTGLALALAALDGTAVTLARELEITPQAISAWTKVPVGQVKAVELITGVPRDKLRPDIFG